MTGTGHRPVTQLPDEARKQLLELALAIVDTYPGTHAFSLEVNRVEPELDDWDDMDDDDEAFGDDDLFEQRYGGAR